MPVLNALRNSLHRSLGRLGARSRRSSLWVFVLLCSGALVSPALSQGDSPTSDSRRPSGAPTIDLISQQAPVNARILYVNSEIGQDRPTAGDRATNPYQTITYAIRQAEALRTTSSPVRPVVIQLDPGTYRVATGEQFPLRLQDGMILQGDRSNQGTTTQIINESRRTAAGVPQRPVAIQMTGNSQIRGVTVTTPLFNGVGVEVQSGSPEIRDNTFINSFIAGVVVMGSSTPTIADNDFSYQFSTFLPRPEAGILMTQTAGGLITDNDMKGMESAIVIRDQARPRLHGNTIQFNTDYGVWIQGEARPNLGTQRQPGRNFIQENGTADLYNATSFPVPVVGNQLGIARIQGPVDFEAGGTTDRVTFTDIRDHWAAEYIEALAGLGVVQGFGDNTFRPGAGVTRREFAAMLSRAFQAAPVRSPGQFRDVNPGTPGYADIQTAYRLGFMSGNTDGNFRPNEPISRVEVLLALANGLNYAPADPRTVQIYQDSRQIPPTAIAAVAAATRNNIVVNYPNPNRLNPRDLASRAEVAAMVYQAIASIDRVDSINSPYLVRGR